MSRVPKMGVYAIENKKSGHIYVGSSMHLAHRISQHKSGFEDETRPLPVSIREDLTKNGTQAFEIFVLQRTADAEQLGALEAYWAEVLGAHTEQGYNIAPIRRDGERWPKVAREELGSYSLHVGTRIHSLRKQLGWNQTDLGEKVGLSTISISQIETSERVSNRLTPPYLLRFALALGVSVNDLFPTPEAVTDPVEAEETA